MNTLKIINFIKTYFLQIVGGIIAVCLIGVAIYSYLSSSRQKNYEIIIKTYGKNTVIDTVQTKGFPYLTKYKSRWELTDFNGVVRTGLDSISVISISQK